jgi:GNAT superfamily N-acetyltransferase
MLPRPIRHRRARRTDFAATRALLSVTGILVPAADRTELRRFRHLVADLGSDLYVAVRDERVVGIVHVTYTRHLLHGWDAELSVLVVAPEERRGGIGRSLAALAVSRARRRGCRRLLCRPEVGAADAPAFLGALGWRTSGARFEIDLPGPSQ